MKTTLTGEDLIDALYLAASKPDHNLTIGLLKCPICHFRIAFLVVYFSFWFILPCKMIFPSSIYLAIYYKPSFVSIDPHDRELNLNDANKGSKGSILAGGIVWNSVDLPGTKQIDALCLNNIALNIAPVLCGVSRLNIKINKTLQEN